MGLTKASVGKNAQDVFFLDSTQKEEVRVALVGNPNVGKSTLFNRLTGMHQHTGNWSGKTVSGAVGSCTYGKTQYALVDLPGCYSLLSHSPEEEVTRDFIYAGAYDAAVVVCDATCLERNLNLVLQTVAAAPKTVVCINFMDEAEKKNISIHRKKLEDILSVPVVCLSARKGTGVDALFCAIEQVRTRTGKEAGDLQQAEFYVTRAEKIAKETVSFQTTGYNDRDRKLDRVLAGKPGFLVMLFLLFGVFWLTIFGSNYPSQWLSGLLFQTERQIYDGLLGLGVPVALNDALIHGVYRMLIWVVSVMLPPMAIFFPLFTLMEDLGYLPRVAFNLDKCFQKCAACGKQALTMCMGFGCNAAGVVGARIIDSKRERLIAMLTNSFVPCNGRFPLLISMISMFFAAGIQGVIGSFVGALLLLLVILLGVLMTFAASKLLSVTILRGVPSSFTLELPPYRKPQIGKTIVRSVLDRTLFVLGRAAAVAAPAGLVVWLFANVSVGGQSLLSFFSGALDPIGRLLGLDGVILMAFLLGFPANETVIPIMLMAYISGGSLTEVPENAVLLEILKQNGWTVVTAVNVMLFSLMHWPCSTTLMTIKKESGSMKWAVAATVLPTLFGMVICFFVAWISRLFI